NQDFKQVSVNVKSEYDSVENRTDEHGSRSIHEPFQLGVRASISKTENIHKCSSINDAVKIEKYEILTDNDVDEKCSHTRIKVEYEGEYQIYKTEKLDEYDAEVEDQVSLVYEDGIKVKAEESGTAVPNNCFSSTYRVVEHLNKSERLEVPDVKTNPDNGVAESAIETDFVIHADGGNNFASVNKNKNPSNVQDKRHACDLCSYKSAWRNDLKRHTVTHMDSSKIKWYKCDTCSYKSKHNKVLKTHMLRHKDLSEIKWHECDLCDYKSKYKADLKFHSIQHKDPSEIDWYKCSLCDYKTIRSCSLNAHMLIHKHPSEVTWYECNLCDYKTNRKDSLKLHVVQHKKPSEINWYECALCDYKSKYKKGLRTHNLLRHKNHSEIKWHKCTLCNYKTKQRHLLKPHSVSKHKNVSDVIWHECSLCEYKAVRKYFLDVHMLKHKDASETKWYRCDFCDYKSNRKDTLKRHTMKHTDGPKYEMINDGNVDKNGVLRLSLKMIKGFRNADFSVGENNVPNMDKYGYTDVGRSTTKSSNKYDSLINDAIKIERHEVLLNDVGIKIESDLWAQEQEHCSVADLNAGCSKNMDTCAGILKEHCYFKANCTVIKTEYECVDIKSEVGETSMSGNIHESHSLGGITTEEDYIKIKTEESGTASRDCFQPDHQDSEGLNKPEQFEAPNIKMVLDNAVPESYPKKESPIKKCIQVHSYAQDCLKRNINPVNVKKPMRYLTRVTLPQKDPSKIKWHKCKLCDYKSMKRSGLVTHNIFYHKAPASRSWNWCDMCDYKSQYKTDLMTHILLRHKDPTQVIWQKCSLCEYETVRKNNLYTHMLKNHVDTSTTGDFKCDTCNFKSRWKDALDTHVIVNHVNPVWYKCGSCNYRSTRECSVRSHMIRHHTSS
ncbi:hypothetical protein NQ315_003452, partial [Exocentrus adspersus]